MPLALDADQALYAETVQRFLSGLPETDSIRSLITGDRPPDPVAAGRIWRRLVDDLGATALPLGEGLGGGASWREVGIVLEGIGRNLAAAPYTSVMTAVRLLEATGSPAAEPLLAAAAEGHRFVVAVPASSWGTVTPTLTYADGRLAGAVHGVLDAAHAETWLCPVAVAGALRIAVVQAADSSVVARAGVDVTRGVGDVGYDGAPATLLEGGDVAEAVAEALAFAATAVAVEAIGGAERCLRLTVDYANVRQQFGRPIGSFQAVKHTLADVVRLVEPAKAAAYAALEAVATDDPDQPRAAALAKLTAVEAYAAAAGAAIQLHGAIGFTWEHELQLHFKRAVSSRVLFGRRDRLRRLLASHLLHEAVLAQPLLEVS